MITHQCSSFSEYRLGPGPESFLLPSVGTQLLLLDNPVIHRGYPDTGWWNTWGKNIWINSGWKALEVALQKYSCDLYFNWYNKLTYTHSELPVHKKQTVLIHLRISSVAELPRLGEGGQGSEVERLMMADQLALHLLRGTNGAGAPLKRGWTTCRLWEQLWRAVACRLVAGEQYGRLTLTRGWKRRRRKRKDGWGNEMQHYKAFYTIKKP